VLRAFRALAAVLLSGACSEAAVFERVESRHVPPGVPVRVLLPPSYESSPERRYPVLYFLHDARGDETTLEASGVAVDLLSRMRSGQLAEVLVVAPRGMGSWYVDSFDGRVRYAAFLEEELVPWTEARLRVSAGRPARAVCGISMGGFGALRWAFSRPDLFAVAGSLSGAVQQMSWRTAQRFPLHVRPSLSRAFGRDERANRLRQHDLYERLLDDPTLAARAPHVLLRCGREDRYELAAINSFLGKFLSACGVSNEVVLEPGPHDWSYWRGSLPELIRGVAARLTP
jgi:S-formylglutathione hydrolase FrmB